MIFGAVTSCMLKLGMMGKLINYNVALLPFFVFLFVLFYLINDRL